MILEDLNFKVPEKLFAPAESLHVEGAICQESLVLGPDIFVLDQPISWNADITNTGNALLIEGVAEASVTVDCSRCLEPSKYELSGSIEGYFLIHSDEEEEIQEGEEDEFDALPQDHVLDFEELIMGALMLELPLMPLCSDDCKGLCPTCGHNLNEGDCSCKDQKPVDPLNPFAVLAGLSFD